MYRILASLCLVLFITSCTSTDESSNSEVEILSEFVFVECDFTWNYSNTGNPTSESPGTVEIPGQYQQFFETEDFDNCIVIADGTENNPYPQSSKTLYIIGESNIRLYGGQNSEYVIFDDVLVMGEFLFTESTDDADIYQREIDGQLFSLAFRHQNSNLPILSTEMLPDTEIILEAFDEGDFGITTNQ